MGGSIIYKGHSKKISLILSVCILLLFVNIAFSWDLPEADLNTPDNYATISGETVVFNCTAESELELVNISLYHNISGTWQKNQTTALSGSENSTAWTFYNLSNGTYIWNCKVYDNNSNSSWGGKNHTFTVGIDNDNPVIMLSMPDDGALINDSLAIFGYNVSDESSGIANCSLILNGTVEQTSNNVIESKNRYFGKTGINDGTYVWSIGCYDNSDNYNHNNSGNRTLTVQDKKSPSVNIFKPSNNTNSTENEVYVEFGVYDSMGISNCSLILNGAVDQINDNINSDIESFSVYNLTTGRHNFSVNCTDASFSHNVGSSETHTINLNIESDPPVITLRYPADDYTDDDGELEFIFNATDYNNRSGLSNCELIINGSVDQWGADFVEGSNQTINTTLEDGYYIWSINCSDDYYNEGSSESRSITVQIDEENPDILLSEPSPGSSESGTNMLTFSFNVSDDSELENCSLYVNGTINETNYTTSTGEGSIITYLVNGIYLWSVECFDYLGNAGLSESWNLNIDTSPEVTLNGPVNGYSDSDGDVVFNYTVTDNAGIRNCSLYHNISGNWQINLTNTFVQLDVPLYFYVNDIPDDTYFIWNILCYDSDSYSDWGDSNRSVFINNTPPTFSIIPDPEWHEDDVHTLNLSNYSSDVDGDIIGYSFSNISNIDVSVNNTTGIISFVPDFNWYGEEIIVFYVFDDMGQSDTSNNVTLNVTSGSDNPPQITYISPADNSLDADGYVFINCSAFDDYGLYNVSLYTNITGNWTLNQTKSISGNYDSALFTIEGLTDGTYKWGCVAFDNASNSVWSENRTFNVSISVSLEHHIPDKMVNNINTSRYVLITYSGYLNNSLTLGNLTIYESDGELYYTKDMSNSYKFSANSLIIHPRLINITPTEIFDNNFSIGNTAGLNLSVGYSYAGKDYEAKEYVVIEVVEEI